MASNDNDIREITAVYKGDPILIGHTYDAEDVVVTVYHYSGRKYETRTGFYVGSTMVHNLGLNVFYAFYKGMQAPFYVRGVKNIELLSAIRTKKSRLQRGDPLESGSEITPEDLDVYLVNKDKTHNKLNSDQYTINPDHVYSEGITVNMHPDKSTPKYSEYCEYSKVRITHDNKYDTASGVVTIPTKYKFISMKAWYEGFPIPEDQKPQLGDICIQMDTHSGKTISIPNNFHGIMFERLGILDGCHIIKVNYIAPDNSYTLAATVHVPVYTSSVQTGNPFRCIYVKEDGEEVDLSDFFYEEFRIPNTDDIFITWTKFLNAAEYLYREGRYILDAPIHTGLDNRHDQRWLVTVTLNPSALKANVIKNL